MTVELHQISLEFKQQLNITQSSLYHKLMKR